MFLKATIKGKMLNNVFEIPRKAIINDDNVFVVKDNPLTPFIKGDSVLAISPIEVIKLNEKTAYIRGLTQGEKVVTQTPPGAKEGMNVKEF